MGIVHYICLRNANKAAHSGFETQRRRHQKSKTGVPVAPKKDMFLNSELSPLGTRPRKTTDTTLSRLSNLSRNLVKNQWHLCISICTFRCFTDPKKCPDGHSMSMWLYLREPRASDNLGFVLNSGSQTTEVGTGGITVAHQNHVV